MKLKMEKERSVNKDTFNEVLSAHAQMSLVKVDDPLDRVLDVGSNREVEEVVGAVALGSEAIIQLLPRKRLRDYHTISSCKIVNGLTWFQFAFLQFTPAAQ